MKKVALIVENSKEFNDYIIVLNKLNLLLDIKVKIIYLAKIYYDDKQEVLLNKIQFNYEVLSIENIYNKPFKDYTLLEKIILIKSNTAHMLNFIKGCTILLSGIQTVFERVLYAQIRKHNLKIKTIVYHRHILFDDKVNTTSSLVIHNRFVNTLLTFFNMDGFLIEKKAVGYADKYLVLGEINKAYLIEKGIKKDKIECTGSIEYDDLEKFSPFTSTKKVKKYCYITSACEWIGDMKGEDYQKERLNNFLKYCKKENIREVTIRIHPRENVTKYEKLRQKFDFIKLQYPSINPLLEDLKEFEIFIGSLSTVLFEVMLINKKVIFYVLDKEMYRYKHLLQKFSLPYITKIEELKNYLAKYNNIDGSKFITYNKNEKAIDRITNLIKKELDAK